LDRWDGFVLFEGRYGLRRALFQDLEVLIGQSRDCFSFVVGHDYVEDNYACFYFYRGGRGGIVGSGSLRMERSNGKKGHRERPDQIVDSPTSHCVLIMRDLLGH
jgi:hypothetical protein